MQREQKNVSRKIARCFFFEKILLLYFSKRKKTRFRPSSTSWPVLSDKVQYTYVITARETRIARAPSARKNDRAFLIIVLQESPLYFIRMISGKWLINAIITPAVAWFMRHRVFSFPVNRKVLHDRCLKFKLIRVGSWQLCLIETIKLHGFIPLACFLFVWFIQI